MLGAGYDESEQDLAANLCWVFFKKQSQPHQEISTADTWGLSVTCDNTANHSVKFILKSKTNCFSQQFVDSDKVYLEQATKGSANSATSFTDTLFLSLVC